MQEGSRTPSSSIHTDSVHPGGKINLNDQFFGAGSSRRELRPVVRKLFAQLDTFSSKASTLEKWHHLLILIYKPLLLLDPIPKTSWWFCLLGRVCSGHTVFIKQIWYILRERASK